MLSGEGGSRDTWSIIVRMLPVAALLSLLASTAGATDNSLRIHRYSAFDLQAASSKKSVATTSGEITRGRTHVSVYGKRLTLDLETNTRLTEQLPDANGQLAPLRGAVEGKAGSWVRLTQTTAGTHGLIWDGTELYVVEPSNSVNAALAVSLPEPDTATVIFRLSDTTLDLGIMSCGSTHLGDQANHTGRATYQALTAELSRQIDSAGGIPTLRLEMQTLADAAFRAQYSSDQAALEALMVRLNNIDGIFTAQIGLQVQAIDIEIHDADPEGLSQSTNADALVNSLGELRSSNPVMGSYGVTHLFTGRDLDGETLGIAYIGKVCDVRYGASLSEVRNRGAWIDSLVAAHELGHQLGAIHDGTGTCASTPAQSYLMGEQINGNSELSQCSRDSILARMQQAACLVPVGAPDVSLSPDITLPQSTPGTSFNWLLPIRNLGTGAADRPTVHLTLPANLIVDSSAIAGGSCIALNNDAGGTVDCIFDTLAANETRSLDLGLRAGAAGSYQISVAVDVANDNNPLNNNAVYTLSIATTVPTGNAGTPPAQGGNASTGGGAVNALCLLALSLLAGWRRRHLRKYAA